MRLMARLLCLVVLVAATVVPFPTVASAAVTSQALNVRAAPTTSAAILDVLPAGAPVGVLDVVSGEEVEAGDSTWYRIGSGQYVYARYVSTSGTGSVAGASGSSGERWIHVDLSNLVARAMVGNEAVYTAPITPGTADFPTPTGTFSILRRVYNETMDSSTIGIPNDAPGGYYLTGVLYTQYFTPNGNALHYNYWSSPQAFGNTAGSHGCVGMRLADSAFFWNFADIGTRVTITY